MNVVIAQIQAIANNINRLLGKVKLTDGTNDVEIDANWKGLRTIDTVHKAIHDSKYYSFSNKQTVINIAAPRYWMLTNPAANYPHIILDFASIDGGTVEVFEAPTTTANGTAITSYNHNRNSVNVPDLLCYYSPTVTADGTLIQTRMVGAQGTNNGASINFEQEFILKVSTSYLIKFTTFVNGSQATLNVNFYES